MPYQIRYSFWIDWVGPGAGPMTGLTAPNVADYGGGGSMAQTKGFVGNPALTPVAGTGAGGILQASDITAITNAAAADMVTQITAALPTLNNWPQGLP